MPIRPDSTVHTGLFKMRAPKRTESRPQGEPICLIKMWRSNVAATAKEGLRPVQIGEYLLFSIAIEILPSWEKEWISGCASRICRNVVPPSTAHGEEKQTE